MSQEELKSILSAHSVFDIKDKENKVASNSDDKGVSQHRNDDDDINSDISSIDETSQCGLAGFYPRWLQMFNSTFWLLIILCYFSTIGTAFLGFKAVIAPILEKRYNLTSTAVGAIMSSADISAAINGILLTFYASQKHKGHWIGYSLIIYMLGTILFIAPHFLVDTYYYLEDDSSRTLCKAELNLTVKNDDCSSHLYSTFWIYTFLFVLGQMLCGAGNATRYNLSIAFLDENVSPDTSPLYVAIIHMMSTIGPTLGYIIGGALTDIYVDWPKDPPKGHSY